MKTSKYFILTLFSLIGTVSIMFFSCEKESISPLNEPVPQKLFKSGETSDLNAPVDKIGGVCGEIMERWITDSEGNRLGKAKIYNDQDFLYVEMSGKSGYKIKTAQMHIASTTAGIPMGNDGEPALGKFAYAIKNKKELPMVEMKVPVSELQSNMLITTTAEVVKFQGGTTTITRVWIEGNAYGTSTTAKVFGYALGECPGA